MAHTSILVRSGMVLSVLFASTLADAGGGKTAPGGRCERDQDCVDGYSCNERTTYVGGATKRTVNTCQKTQYFSAAESAALKMSVSCGGRPANKPLALADCFNRGDQVVDPKTKKKVTRGGYEVLLPPDPEFQGKTGDGFPCTSDAQCVQLATEIPVEAPHQFACLKQPPNDVPKAHWDAKHWSANVPLCFRDRTRDAPSAGDDSAAAWTKFFADQSIVQPKMLDLDPVTLDWPKYSYDATRAPDNKTVTVSFNPVLKGLTAKKIEALIKQKKLVAVRYEQIVLSTFFKDKAATYDFAGYEVLRWLHENPNKAPTEVTKPDPKRSSTNLLFTGSMVQRGGDTWSFPVLKWTGSRFEYTERGVSQNGIGEGYKWEDITTKGWVVLIKK